MDPACGADFVEILAWSEKMSLGLVWRRRNRVGNVVVSTIEGPPVGGPQFETALIVPHCGIEVVAKYPTRALAKEGHVAWSRVAGALIVRCPPRSRGWNGKRRARWRVRKSRGWV